VCVRVYVIISFLNALHARSLAKLIPQVIPSWAV
jgi:hypothetical protein